MTLCPLPRVMIEPLVRNALVEDLGLAGDITSAAVIPFDHRTVLQMASRQAGVIAGLDLAVLAFELIDPAVTILRHMQDGDHVLPGTVIATIEGRSQALLTAERTALNFISHLSGIATLTATMAAAIEGCGARIACTRKTTPGLRAIEKYAVRAGGGMNHRFSLADAVLIKDNHIAVAGGVAEAIRRAKAHVGHMVKIEVEVDTIDQLRVVMDEGVDAVLLDNMTPEQLRAAVEIVAGRAITEASGRVNLETVAGIAATGVDLISIGWLTHSAPILDIGLDVVAEASGR
jgi:nicotinate-nucleotide pyrophosphorylase (carboxylating)